MFVVYDRTTEKRPCRERSNRVPSSLLLLMAATRTSWSTMLLIHHIRIPSVIVSTILHQLLNTWSIHLTYPTLRTYLVLGLPITLRVRLLRVISIRYTIGSMVLLSPCHLSITINVCMERMWYRQLLTGMVIKHLIMRQPMLHITRMLRIPLLIRVFQVAAEVHSSCNSNNNMWWSIHRAVLQ